MRVLFLRRSSTRSRAASPSTWWAWAPRWSACRHAAQHSSQTPTRFECTRLTRCRIPALRQATTGLLFAKTLSVAAQNPYLSGQAFNPVLALDIFLVQAAANALLSHFIGAAISLWLLRSVTQP
jgi:hypothetical protein